MSKLSINSLRYGIAVVIKKKFNIEGTKIINCNFEVHNILHYPVKIIIKQHRENKKSKAMIRKEKGMTIDNLKKIGNDIKNDSNAKKYFLQQGYFYKTESNNDVGIEGKNPTTNNLSNDEEINNLINQYKKTKDIDIAQALISSGRKILKSQFETAKRYFNEKYLDKIKRIYNTYNFCHNNREGEEIYDKKNNKILKKGINEKIKNLTSEQLFKLCDYLLEFIDIFRAMNKLGDGDENKWTNLV